ncbi:MAG: aromatic acid exporter family protein, partial [Bacilli bacterium]
MISIGQRTVKTAIGTALAVSIALMIGLEYPTSAGIITILCIQTTRKKSLRSATSRFFACNLAMLMSAAIFELFGYYTPFIALHLLLLIPILVRFRIQEGVVT